MGGASAVAALPLPGRPPSREGLAWAPPLALIFVQLAYGGYHVLTKKALADGVNQLVFCTWRDCIALLVLAPLAAIVDRGKRPPLSWSLLSSFLILGITGVFGNQLLFLLGLGIVGPTTAAALQPAIPVFTFLLSVLMGMETLNWRQRDGLAKVTGVAVCVVGAVVMATYRGPALVGGVGGAAGESGGGQPPGRSMAGHVAPPGGLGGNIAAALGPASWHVGVLCLIGNCSCMALYLTLQAPVLARYPSVSVTAFGYLFGAAAIAAAGAVLVEDPSEWWLTGPVMVAVLYAALVASALNYLLMTWVNKRVGPSIVALYMPLQPLASAVLSRVFLGSPIFLSSVLGGTSIIAGLYLVAWGRGESVRVGAAGYQRIGSAKEEDVEQ